MRTTRQIYIDSNLQAAREAGCDTIQLKLDGWWARVVIVNGQGTFFSRTGRELPAHAFQTHNDINACLVGELMFGTQWAQQPQLKNKTFLFDLWSIEGYDLEGVPYKERYAMLRALHKRLPGTFLLVNNFPILDYDKMWARFVLQDDYEGLIFRHSRGLMDAPIYRQKNVIIDRYVAHSFEEGEGKFAGMLGAVVATNGGKVGGGFTDEERVDIWEHQASYVGRTMEVEARKRFESGLLRHPNFVRWL